MLKCRNTSSQSQISIPSPYLLGEELSIEEQNARLVLLRNSLVNTDGNTFLGGTFEFICNGDCQNCGMHPDINRRDCASAKAASTVKQGMSSEEVYAALGNAHWFVYFHAPQTSSVFFEYWYLLSDGNILRIQYSQPENTVNSFSYSTTDDIIDKFSEKTSE